MAAAHNTKAAALTCSSQVCRSAEACGHLHFDTTRNIWFVMGTAELFPCDPAGVAGPLSLPHLMAKVRHRLLPGWCPSEHV